ncbi:MAG: nitroreductase family protein [Desulfobacterales bacterium]|nr:nitroreductase family protein [Desulfobacterales bacterium]
MAETYTLAEATMKVIQDRRSIREWTAEPVSEEDIALIMEAGRQAPSGENAQPWRFIVVKDPAMRKKLAGLGGRRKRPSFYGGVRDAPDAGTIRRPAG